MEHARTTLTSCLLVAATAFTALSGGCVVRTGYRHHDTVYVHRAHGGGPVHGAVHGVHCIEHAATFRGCD